MTVSRGGRTLRCAIAPGADKRRTQVPDARPFVEFVHPDDRDATNEAARQLNEGTTVVNFDKIATATATATAPHRWLEWPATPSADGSRIYATARDVTNRKEEEECRLAPILADRDRFAEARQKIEATIETRAFLSSVGPLRLDVRRRDRDDGSGPRPALAQRGRFAAAPWDSHGRRVTEPRALRR